MAKIKKIIVLIEFPFCKRDYGRFGIDILKKNGFEVDVWDFAPLLNKNVSVADNNDKDHNFDRYQSFTTTEQVKKTLSRLNNSCFIISFILYNRKNYWIYRLFSKNKISYGMHFSGSSYPLLTWQTNITPKKRLKNIFHLRSKISNLYFNHVARQLIAPASLIFAGGAKTNMRYLPIGPSTDIMWIHYLDYDIYLKEKDAPNFFKEKIAVFLDENLPFHRDWAHCKLPIPCTPEKYYPLLCKFFKSVEKDTGVKIVIAAHPRSTYENLPDYYEGREIVKNETAKLVKESQFTIAHASYSLNYSVLFNKPVLMITTDELNGHFRRNSIEAMAQALQKIPINISSDYSINWDKELMIDSAVYANYRHNYIKKDGTPNLPFWQVVANQIKTF